MARKKIQEQVQEMASKAQELMSKGYELVNIPDASAPYAMPGEPAASLPTKVREVLEHYGMNKSDDCCGHAKNILDGLASQLNEEQKSSAHLKDSTGMELGTPGLGYIKWGVDDRLPTHVFHATGAQVYTARGAAYLTELLSGLGPQLEYHTAIVAGGRLVPISMPFENAGVWLEDRIAGLRAKMKEENSSKEEGNTQEDTSADVPDEAPAEKKGRDKKEYRVAAPPPEPKPSEKLDRKMVGTTAYQLQQAYEDYEIWLDTMGDLSQFLENTNLTDLWSKCAVDDVVTDQYCLVLSFDSVGRKGSWKPKVTRIEHRPVACCRMEKMDEKMRSNYVYYSEAFLYDNVTALNGKNCCAYHALRQSSLLSDLHNYVSCAQSMSIAERQVEHAVFMQEYCGYTSYYQIPAWWSIFTSLVYQYVSTFIIDKTIARNNANMASHLIFISDNYMQAYYSEMGATERDKKIELRNALVSKIDNFLKNKRNNGKCLTLSKFIAPDGKTEIKNIEIIPVPAPSNSTTTEELEELANLIFWGMGIHSNLIASFGKSPSTGGTAQREITLLKQTQLSPRQRRFMRALEDVFLFNKWDKHLKCGIGREVLSTLDASKTGIVEQK